MSSANPRAASAANSQRNNPDRLSNAGSGVDPWEQCARMQYGDDRTYASSVRAQVIGTPADGLPQIEDRLLKALASPGRGDAGLAFLCQMFRLVGTAKSVPALAALLRDAKTADSARLALEVIPGPEAEAALRDALPVLSGPAKAGLIGSIAARHDAAARPALTALKDAAKEPAVVRQAATRALDQLSLSK
jgi:hypothetical protein